MRKMNRWMVFVFLICSLVFLQSCSINKSFVKKDLTSLSPLKVVRYQTPPIRDIALGRVLVGALFGGIGAAVAILTAPEVEKPIDFGELIMKKFCERVSKEITNWPIIIMEKQPVGEDFTYNGTLLKFKLLKSS